MSSPAMSRSLRVWTRCLRPTACWPLQRRGRPGSGARTSVGSPSAGPLTATRPSPWRSAHQVTGSSSAAPAPLAAARAGPRRPHSSGCAPTGRPGYAARHTSAGPHRRVGPGTGRRRRLHRGSVVRRDPHRHRGPGRRGSRPPRHPGAGAANGIPFVVDAAWGAHFGFHPALPGHALACGADALVTSAHKTLPAWSQGALVLAQTERIDPARPLPPSTPPPRRALSGAILASIDASRALVERDGPALLGDLVGQVADLRARLHGGAGVGGARRRC